MALTKSPVDSPAAPDRAAVLPPTIVALGWVSLLTDAASDMIYPLLPGFLLTLGGGALAVGWLEGIAEAGGAVVKLYSGVLGDRLGRRKVLIAVGYSLSALTRPLFSLATAPLHAIVVRAVDRVGKGLRGPPRDAMIASIGPDHMRGHAFGFHRMMDNAGAVVGALLAFVLLAYVKLDLRTIFQIALLPGLCAVLVVLLFVREPKPPATEGWESSQKPSPGVPIGTGARRYLAIVALFSLAGSGDLFLVLRLVDLGLPRPLVPILWMTLQLGKALLNVPGGKAADRYGRRRVVVLAWALYGSSYALLGFVPSWKLGWAALGLYALHYGLGEGGQRALLAECVAPAAFGRAYGMLLAIEGAIALPANVLFGLVYARVGAPAAFGLAGALALGAAAALSTVSIKRADLA